jgi:hypothetical protein
MTWTVASGDVVTASYNTVTKTMTYNGYINASTVGGTPNDTLSVAIPDSRISDEDAYGLCYLFDNGARVVGTIAVGNGGSVFNISRLDIANFAASTNNTHVRFSMTIKIQ